ncbi:TPA: hypothetical protein DEO28_00425 [Candidatus Dependentiae bacterium]|nr:MAG: hypothetical protein UR14_C0001G0065 [candidate division TM6 bacterium GW2011_GWE2_31_21]KKP54055.1 MAG: hypothetical protein UR43_C0001G0073 [candidate division TM6 bacterium GW2011_GWF2_33_332]HBS48362.1 hypothetical protein [Candidatus Dependentiae bacterium]HBZ72964.1 hypothetical protein [Candidatus Dependentiae bacterium]
MKSYYLKEHTADVRLVLQADTLQELFLVAIEGMNNFIKKDFQILKEKDFSIKQNIEISSIDSTSLLIDFLNEILTLMQINTAIFSKIDFLFLAETRLEATIYGFKTNFFDQDIKAVTYHEAQIIKDKNGLLNVTIIFDI